MGLLAFGVSPRAVYRLILLPNGSRFRVEGLGRRIVNRSVLLPQKENAPGV